MTKAVKANRFTPRPCKTHFHKESRLFIFNVFSFFFSRFLKGETANLGQSLWFKIQPEPKNWTVRNLRKDTLAKVFHALEDVKELA